MALINASNCLPWEQISITCAVFGVGEWYEIQIHFVCWPISRKQRAHDFKQFTMSSVTQFTRLHITLYFVNSVYNDISSQCLGIERSVLHWWAGWIFRKYQILVFAYPYPHTLIWGWSWSGVGGPGTILSKYASTVYESSTPLISYYGVIEMTYFPHYWWPLVTPTPPQPPTPNPTLLPHPHPHK